MKKIKINFMGLGYNNHYQADVFVYDGDNLIYEKKTYNGEVLLSLKKCHIYKIIAYFLGETIVYSIYINNDQYCFSFSSNLINYETITFLLTDYHYDNLPIERGEIILWPKT